MNNGRRDTQFVVIAVALVVVIAIASVLICRIFWLNLHVAFAEDQTSIFSSMGKDARASDDPAKIAGYLDYTVSYYPSGSKQEAGSQLDKVVERQRSEVIRGIITELRTKTGEDLGSDPKVWIAKYGRR